ncbi:MBL fold metallo-hydrolase RNA specificity domain-containing protein [Enemella sp. A6]|uniref:MBL fold metallo-hydrolase RNA specificity domain-containing protein n=1 Tax=Enemella sp. A6 TaxID=3440152 RepID=UPI003EBC9E8A
MTEHLTLTFLGAAGTVTGSKYLLTIGRRRVLVDAGLFQGEKQWRERNWDDFPVDPASISDVVLTHAHTDHIGYLPALVARGFSGPVWATEGSIRLGEIVLRDGGKLQELGARDANRGGWSKHEPALPLYTTEDVEATLPLFREVDFDVNVDLGDGLVGRWVRAGHILGSASVHLSLGDAEVLFSGDVGRHDHPILKARKTPPGARYVVMESTYGDREHPEPEVEHQDLAEAITRTVERGGTVLIPAFAIDRTETVLRALTSMQREGRIPDVPVVVDSPMALEALRVYKDVRLDELRDDIEISDFTGLPQLRESRSARSSKALNTDRSPKIIISSSGMLEGGRVLHHLKRLLPDDRNTIALVGYQAEGTRGRALEDGAGQVKIHGRYVKVAAEIVRDREFSVHGDRSDLTDWLRDLDQVPETVFIVHGEPEVARGFAQHLRAELGVVAVVPGYGEIVTLDAEDPDPADDDDDFDAPQY